MQIATAIIIREFLSDSDREVLRLALQDFVKGFNEETDLSEVEVIDAMNETIEELFSLED